MNWDQIKRNWKQVRANVQVTWGKLNEDDLDAIAGRRERLTDFLLKRYGYGREQAEQTVDDFAQGLKAEPVVPGLGIHEINGSL